MLTKASLAKPDTPCATEKFISIWTTCTRQGTWQHLTLSKYKGELSDLRQLVVRPLTLRGQRMLSLVWRHSTRDITKNLPLDEGVQHIIELLRSDFQHAHLHASDGVHQLSISKKGRSHLVSRPQATAAPMQAEPPSDSQAHVSADQTSTHDRAKKRYVDLSRPWLSALGVTDTHRKLVPAMARKWKQINKFVEVFSHAFTDSGLARQRAVKVVDFGCGKGYLTFALHDYLRTQQAVQADVMGVELREDLVQLCNTAAQAAQAEGLHFSQGDVRSQPLQAVDVMIALHACDIATDYAIHSGIRAGASIIMCSPCCHKQIRPQLLSPHPLRPILQHGIHLGQESEMLTDGLRALLLEASGYATQVFEFVSLEHTSKNKMILGVKRQSPSAVATGEVWRQIEEIKLFYGIKEQCLETLLKLD
ncbi:MAG: class I SAM-dependent methyltransferase [Burkholderiales bacterium]